MSKSSSLIFSVSIDKQLVRIFMVTESRALNANKKVNGHRRTFVVDTQWRYWMADVDAACQVDSSFGKVVVVASLWRVGEQLDKVFKNQAYSGIFAYELARWNIRIKKASGSKLIKGFVSLAKRWVVEWNADWTNHFRSITRATSIPCILRLVDCIWPIPKSCYKAVILLPSMIPRYTLRQCLMLNRLSNIK